VGRILTGATGAVNSTPQPEVGDLRQFCASWMCFFGVTGANESEVRCGFFDGFGFFLRQMRQFQRRQLAQKFNVSHADLFLGVFLSAMVVMLVGLLTG